MKIDWTVFEGRQYGRLARTEPRVTLDRRGVIYLNRVAFEALGGPGAVEMLFNHNARILGLRAVDPQRKNAFAVRHHGKPGEKTRRIAASALLHHLRMKPDRTMLFQEVDVDDNGVMALDLDRAVTVSRGAR